MRHPTRWTVERVKSVLCFLFAYFYDLSTDFADTTFSFTSCFLETSRPIITEMNLNESPYIKVPYGINFNDEIYQRLAETELPIHYLKGHPNPQPEDIAAAYFKRQFQGTGRTNAGGKGSGFFRGQGYPSHYQQHPRAWKAGQHPIFRKPGNQVAGNGLWTHTDPPHWGPMYEATVPLRRYVNEVNLWERATSIEHPRRVALLISNLHGTARSYIEMLMTFPVNAEQMTYGASVNNGQMMVSGPTIMCWWLMQTFGEDEQHTHQRPAS